MVASPGELVCEVVPDKVGVDRSFTYRVPAKWADQIEVGSVVRVPFAGRRLRGWVVHLYRDGLPDDRADMALLAISRLVGRGLSIETEALVRWAADEWVGRFAVIARAATPERVVAYDGDWVPLSPRRPPVRRDDAPSAGGAMADVVANVGVSVAVTPPSLPLAPMLAALAKRGPLMVITPSQRRASAAIAALQRHGVGAIAADQAWRLGDAAAVVGTPSGVWAPTSALGAVVVVDEHDKRYFREQSPTFNVRDLAIERARRAGVACVLCSAMPTADALAAGAVIDAPPGEWTRSLRRLRVIDQLPLDPRERRQPSELISALRQADRAAVIVSRLGRARLLACRSCRRLVECTECGSAVRQPERDELVCDRCGTRRPPICAHCSSTGLSNLRAGVDRVAEEMAALMGEPVDVVTHGAMRRGDELPETRVMVGTEALLHRLRKVDVIAFVDIDVDLLAPRYRALEQTAGRINRSLQLVGADGRVIVLTQVIDHALFEAYRRRDPLAVGRYDGELRRRYGYPPYGSVAVIGGDGGAEFMASMDETLRTSATERDDATWVLRGHSRPDLARRLRAVPRPEGALKLQIDPYDF